MRPSPQGEGASSDLHRKVKMLGSTDTALSGLPPEASKPTRQAGNWVKQITYGKLE